LRVGCRTLWPMQGILFYGKEGVTEQCEKPLLQTMFDLLKCVLASNLL
jgi:hypothetical protein